VKFTRKDLDQMVEKALNPPKAVDGKGVLQKLLKVKGKPLVK